MIERQYWLGRKRAALAMARGAASSTARLIHYDLAGRYSVRAAQAPPPFMLPAAPKPAAAPLHLPAAAPDLRQDPDGAAGGPAGRRGDGR